jgi:hypothetical protein
MPLWLYAQVPLHFAVAALLSSLLHDWGRCGFPVYLRQSPTRFHDVNDERLGSRNEPPCDIQKGAYIRGRLGALRLKHIWPPLARHPIAWCWVLHLKTALSRVWQRKRIVFGFL